MPWTFHSKVEEIVDCIAWIVLQDMKMTDIWGTHQWNAVRQDKVHQVVAEQNSYEKLLYYKN